MRKQQSGRLRLLGHGAHCSQDQSESNRRYDSAFEVVLSHTPAAQLRDFSRLFPNRMHLTHDLLRPQAATDVRPEQSGDGAGERQWHRSNTRGASFTVDKKDMKGKEQEGGSLGDIYARKDSSFGIANPLAVGEPVGQQQPVEQQRAM
eukprot:g126.t1